MLKTFRTYSIDTLKVMRKIEHILNVKVFLFWEYKILIPSALLCFLCFHCLGDI